jgi:hypothetical protein
MSIGQASLATVTPDNQTYVTTGGTDGGLISSSQFLDFIEEMHNKVDHMEIDLTEVVTPSHSIVVFNTNATNKKSIKEALGQFHQLCSIWWH